ncbi:hypothetical protein [Paenibacillus sp. GCM10027626]|uniref:hypothetical protein n=1 Tax=Paenibacillus sp. GCM10027626 TaxID=3273411 RepID=UPI003643A4C3
MHSRSTEPLTDWIKRQQRKGEKGVLRDPAWIENYVMQMISETVPTVAAAMLSATSAVPRQSGVTVKETKRYVLAQLELPKSTYIADVRLQVREDRIRICGLAKGKKKIIKLPALVMPRYSRAYIEGSALKIRMRKRQLRKKVYKVEIE